MFWKVRVCEVHEAYYEADSAEEACELYLAGNEPRRDDVIEVFVSADTAPSPLARELEATIGRPS